MQLVEGCAYQGKQVIDAVVPVFTPGIVRLGDQGARLSRLRAQLAAGRPGRLRRRSASVSRVRSRRLDSRWRGPGRQGPKGGPGSSAARCIRNGVTTLMWRMAFRDKAGREVVSWALFRCGSTARRPASSRAHERLHGRRPPNGCMKPKISEPRRAISPRSRFTGVMSLAV